jgi:hypothetical protein
LPSGEHPYRERSQSWQCGSTSLRAELDAAKRAQEQAEAEVASLKRELEAAKRSAALGKGEARRGSDALRAEVDAAKRAQAEAEAVVEKKDRELDAARQAYRELEAQLDFARQARRKVESGSASPRREGSSEMRSAKIELEALRRELDAARSELEQQRGTRAPSYRSTAPSGTFRPATVDLALSRMHHASSVGESPRLRIDTRCVFEVVVPTVVLARTLEETQAVSRSRLRKVQGLVEESAERAGASMRETSGQVARGMHELRQAMGGHAKSITELAFDCQHTLSAVTATLQSALAEVDDACRAANVAMAIQQVQSAAMMVPPPSVHGSEPVSSPPPAPSPPRKPRSSRDARDGVRKLERASHHAKAEAQNLEDTFHQLRSRIQT